MRKGGTVRGDKRPHHPCDLCFFLHQAKSRAWALYNNTRMPDQGYEVISATLEAKGISLAGVSADAFEDLKPTDIHLVHRAKAEACDLLTKQQHWKLIKKTTTLADGTVEVTRDSLSVRDIVEENTCFRMCIDWTEDWEGIERIDKIKKMKDLYVSKRKGKVPEQHKCSKKHTGFSKGMEPA
ncbi:Hypothetical predicted protein [Mytilus galloprovincialis]|uniref:Uncharacterized protein n=1 Tax=Mytilus galloprovincialis TaxID=29158 RepID=A0A8B6E3F9_MYTGA|nr:Hypothetical predicted protein [Mytilus galloprovincialis]